MRARNPRGARLPATPGRRLPEDLLHELRTRGHVRVEARHQGGHNASLIAQALGWPILVLGVITLVGVLVSDADHVMVAVAFLLVGLVAAPMGLLLRRTSRRAAGAVWTMDARGITIDGVGPVPWADLMPCTRRMEPAAHDSGRQLTLVMPMTPAGAQRALLLTPESRRVLHAGVRDTPLTGPQPVTSLRIVTMKELTAEAFASFLDQAHAMYVRPRPY